MGKESTFTVAPRGVGRADYSSSLEFISQPAVRAKQARMSWIGAYTLYTPPFGVIYTVPLPFYTPEGVVQYSAPDAPYHFHSVGVTTARDALCIVLFARFLTYSDIMIWNVEKYYGFVYGYQHAHLLVTSGIKTEEGYYYAAGIAEYSGELTFMIRYEAQALVESVAYG